MKSGIIISLLILYTITGLAQQLGVKSFTPLPNDLDARVHFPKEDKNGEKAAIIKVVTTETGFEFEAGSIGIVATEPKTGEIWVYVPRGSKTLTIKHAQLGILRSYLYPVTIEDGAVYELVLASGRVVTHVEPEPEKTRWLVINSVPAGADLFINNQQVGKCPYMAELPLGKYSWRMDMDLYQPDAGMIVLDAGNEKKEVIISLKPDFGTIRITSSPENGAGVTLDEQPSGKQTPCTIGHLKTGMHEVTIRKDFYETVSRQVTVIAGDTIDLELTMKPTFAGVTIVSDPPADIFINGEYKSRERWSGRLSPGVHTFEARLEHYKPDIQKHAVTIGQPLMVNLQPQARTGTLKVISTPYDAKIEIDGMSHGNTPATIRNLITGTHTLRITKDGYSPVEKTIETEEDKTNEIKINLQNSVNIRINSNPSGASLSLDGKYLGTTPQKLETNPGEHEAELSREGYKTLHQPFTVSEFRQQYDFILEKNREKEPEITETVTELPRSFYIFGIQYYVPMMKGYYDDTTEVDYINSFGMTVAMKFISRNHRFSTELSVSYTAFRNKTPNILTFTRDLTAQVLPLRIAEDWYFVPRSNHFFMFIGLGLDYTYWEQYSYLTMEQKEMYYIGATLRAGFGFRFSDNAGMEIYYGRSVGSSGKDKSLFYDSFTVAFPLRF